MTPEPSRSSFMPRQPSFDRRRQAAPLPRLFAFKDRSEAYQNVLPLAAQHGPDFGLQIDPRLLSEPFTAVSTDSIPVAGTSTPLSLGIPPERRVALELVPVK